MNKRHKWQKFDERQLAIRSNVFAKMWVVTGVLLFLCAFIESAFEAQWAIHWQTYILIAVVSFTYGGIELLLRDAYFEKNGMAGWSVPYLIALTATINTVWRIVGFMKGDQFAANGIMTEDGGFFIIGLLLFSYGAVGVVKSRRLRYQSEKQDV
jgi:hypothetical protein